MGGGAPGSPELEPMAIENPGLCEAMTLATSLGYCASPLGFILNALGQHSSPGTA